MLKIVLQPLLGLCLVISTQSEVSAKPPGTPHAKRSFQKNSRSIEPTDSNTPRINVRKKNVDHPERAHLQLGSDIDGGFRSLTLTASTVLRPPRPFKNRHSRVTEKSQRSMEELMNEGNKNFRLMLDTQQNTAPIITW